MPDDAALLAHPEYRGLLADVLDHPADDFPRLALADWIDERGMPRRAELIRLQIALEGRDPADPANWPALRRADDLIALLPRPRGWALVAPDHYDPAQPRGNLGVVRRGFVEAVCLRPGAFFRLAPDLFAHQPVTRVRLLGVQPTWQLGGDGPIRWPDAEAIGLSGLLRAPGNERLFSDGHATMTDALDALSAACVRYGRWAVVALAELEARGEAPAEIDADGPAGRMRALGEWMAREREERVMRNFLENADD